MILFLHVYAFDAPGDGGKDFVGDCTHYCGKPLYGHVRSENLDGVADFHAGCMCDVYHAEVHADIADGGTLHSVDNK